MTEPFQIIDKRGRTPSGLQVRNLDAEMANLRRQGVTLPKSQTMARIQAKRMGDMVAERSLVNDLNNAEAASFRRRRLDAQRHVLGTNMEIALPKMREPGQSLIDRGVPFQIGNPDELSRIWSWCRLYYSTHDLIPLLVDIYSKFPLQGLELESKDPLIQKFYEDMFFNELNYEEFLPDALGREYFVVGEVTSLAHFNESLGIWSSEEIIDPNQLLITKSLFVQRERVQLMVKELVDALRDGPGVDNETPSQRKERLWQYEQLRKHYPEFIEAAKKEDGVDLSDALVSRLVNRAFYNDLRGTPHMMRSFRTLMTEEALVAAQDAVADRMYAPLILAKLGLPSIGDGEPWLPDPSALDAVRDDLQAAMAADFKLMVGNVGLDIQSVFGKEILPRFEEDFSRIDAKIMQAWGIGEALIAGGTSGGGTYASSSLNREFASQLMSAFQKKVTRHILKRAEVIAEAQEHYDYELKGGIRRPIYREIVRVDPETGEEEIVRVPKLLLPEVKWRTLNLRDEAQEREFLHMLKQAGVPVSDQKLTVNVDIEFEQELERQAEETVKKQMAQAQAMDKAKRLCDEQGLAYPPELAQYLSATLNIRAQIAQTEGVELQTEMVAQQAKQSMPAGQLGLLPGTMGPMAMPPGSPGGAPTAAPPDAPPPEAGAPGPPGDMPMPQELPRNRARPPESDDMRANMPRAAGKGKRRQRRKSRLEIGPSSYGRSLQATEADVEQAVKRRQVVAEAKIASVPKVSDLVQDPDFYVALNIQQHEAKIRDDFQEIKAGRAVESAKLLKEALDQYEEIFGVEPQW